MAQLRRVLWICAAVSVAGALVAARAGTATDRGPLPEKAALAERATAAQAAALAQELAHPKPGDAAAARPRPAPAGPPPTGIVELPSPFPAREYVLESVGWQDASAGRRLTVYAGRMGDDAAQGVIVVAEAAIPSNDPLSAVAYPAPGKHGALRFVGVRGEVLVLRDEQGGVLAFDVSARRYR